MSYHSRQEGSFYKVLCTSWEALKVFHNSESRVFCEKVQNKISDRGYGDWPPAREPRPDTAQPGIERLFFAGDGRGPKVWGACMDAAFHSAIFYVDEMTGRSYVKDVLPEYRKKKNEIRN